MMPSQIHTGEMDDMDLFPSFEFVALGTQYMSSP
jgi:hypothetical protein